MHNTRVAHARLLALFAAAALPSWSADLGAQVSEAFLREHAEALEVGEPALTMSRGGPITNLEAAIIVDASPTAIWDILVACEIAPEYVPNVVACRSIELLDDGAAELFIQTVKPAFFVPSFEHVFRMDYEPHRRIVISRVSGPIRVLDSTWELLPRSDGRVLLTYTLAVNPGIPIPRLFVRQTLRRDLPKVLTAVQQRAAAATPR